jgi:hypothetical protein
MSRATRQIFFFKVAGKVIDAISVNPYRHRIRLFLFRFGPEYLPIFMVAVREFKYLIGIMKKSFTFGSTRFYLNYLLFYSQPCLFQMDTATHANQTMES